MSNIIYIGRALPIQTRQYGYSLIRNCWDCCDTQHYNYGLSLASNYLPGWLTAAIAPVRDARLAWTAKTSGRTQSYPLGTESAHDSLSSFADIWPGTGITRYADIRAYAVRHPNRTCAVETDRVMTRHDGNYA